MDTRENTASAQALPQLVPHNPHYARLGGHDAVVRLVDAFYGYMDTLPEAARVRAMHPKDLTAVRATLTVFLTEWLGGARDYSATRGAPRLRHRHAPFAIGAAEREAWLTCMARALDDVAPDREIAAELMQSFTRTAAAITHN